MALCFSQVHFAAELDDDPLDRAHRLCEWQDRIGYWSIQATSFLARKSRTAYISDNVF